MRHTCTCLTGMPKLTAAFLLFSSCLQAAISGVVKDPSGAVVSGAAVSAQPLPRGTLLQSTTDAKGQFRFDNATPGSYTLTVTQAGFESWEEKITLSAKNLDLAVSLKLKLVTETVRVSGKRSLLANSDPNYIALRGAKLTKVYRVENVALQRDAGTFTFRSGSFSFLPPVLGHVTAGVFVGEGNFQLKPANEMAVKHLHLESGADAVSEDFTDLVIYFTDATYDEILKQSKVAEESNQAHQDALKRVKDVLERRREPASGLAGGVNPMTSLERILNFEDIPNYEAEVLAELYNSQPGSFRAFLNGKKYAHLRFLVNARGAMPMLSAPEEVTLLNYDPSSYNDGVWYLSHFTGEMQSGRASSSEEKRLLAPEHYGIHVFIGKVDLLGKQPDVGISCDVRVRALDDGIRMVKFDLFPDLQVQRVAWNGKEIAFIQENRKKDGSFYLQMPEALTKDQTYQITFEYAGTLGPTWYPTPAGPSSRATYDLGFRVPHGTTMVSVGKQVSEARDGAFDVSGWSSQVPIERAVFRDLAQVWTKATTEETTHTELRAYVLGGPGTGARAQAPPPGPGSMRPGATMSPATQAGTSTGGSIAPVGPGRGLNAAPPVRAGVQPTSPGDVLIDAGNVVRVFNTWFGPSGYNSLSVVVGGGANSLPGLVFTSPVIMAGFNSIGARGAPLSMKTTLDEAFARQVARQWWGNTVGPVSFHDAWLSLGFADFSASLFDLVANPGDFDDHWDKARAAILHLPSSPYYVSQVRPNDTGPIWMGLLNGTSRTPGADNIVSASKGGYVLHMLRCMMWDPKSNDNDFRAMMQDYLKQFANQTASTEDFKAVVGKHMKPVMDLDGNHRMDWFFNDWVYGTDVPSYRLEYSLATGEDHKTVLTGKLTQSGVAPGFKMLVPVFGEFGTFGAKTVRIGVVSIQGNATQDFQVALPEQPERVSLNVNHDVLADKEEVKLVK